MRTITVRGRQLWPRPPRPGRHEAPDPRSLIRRWEDGPDLPPAPPGGSMVRDYERAGRAAYRGRCDDTGEHASTVMLPRFDQQSVMEPFEEWLAELRGDLDQDYPPALVPMFCPRCEAPDDQPHFIGCPFYDEAEAEAWRLASITPLEVRAGALDPAAWRPYLSPEEYARMFPGLPEEADPGPHTGDLEQVSPELADQLARLDAEAADYMNQRAVGHVLYRARLLAELRATLDLLHLR